MFARAFIIFVKFLHVVGEMFLVFVLIFFMSKVANFMKGFLCLLDTLDHFNSSERCVHICVCIYICMYVWVITYMNVMVVWVCDVCVGLDWGS